MPGAKEFYKPANYTQYQDYADSMSRKAEEAQKLNELIGMILNQSTVNKTQANPWEATVNPTMPGGQPMSLPPGPMPPGPIDPWKTQTFQGDAGRFASPMQLQIPPRYNSKYET